MFLKIKICSEYNLHDIIKGNIIFCVVVLNIQVI